jgi:hypothetical protein
MSSASRGHSRDRLPSTHRDEISDQLAVSNSASGSSRRKDMERGRLSPGKPPQSPRDMARSFYERFRARDKEIPDTFTSILNLLTHSPLLVLLAFVPLSWIAYFIGRNERKMKKIDPNQVVNFGGTTVFACMS